VEHLEHFGLSRDPFSNDPQLSVYFPSAEHASAERRLRRGVTQQKGLCLLTGPAGAGKSMVVRHLLESLEEEVYEACLLVPVPGVADVTWVLSRFAAHLGVEEPSPERAALLAQIYDQMAIVREDGRHVVLIIDESDVLAERGALGDLRALLNLEYEERRLLTLVLVGPNEIQETLAKDAGLAARVDVHVRLRPLDPEAATQYLTHRVRRVGGSPAILDNSATAALIERAGGIVRRMNSIADNALFEAFLAGRVSATADDVKRAADELEMGEGARTSAAASVRPPPAAAAKTAARPAAPARRPAQGASLDSVFDQPTGPRRGADVTTLLSEGADLDDVIATPTHPPRPRAKAPAFTGRGAPDKTMMLGMGESFDLEAEPMAASDKEEEIDDLFADIVEEP
jgi:type II secretory pathway predicted ATPase ExeA